MGSDTGYQPERKRAESWTGERTRREAEGGEAMGGIVSRSPAISTIVEEAPKPQEAVFDKDQDLLTIGATPSRSLGWKEELGIPLSTSSEALLLNADTLFVQDFIRKYPGSTDIPHAEKLVRVTLLRFQDDLSCISQDFETARSIIMESLRHHRFGSLNIHPYALDMMTQKVIGELQARGCCDLTMSEVHQLLENLCRMVQNDRRILC